MYFSHKYNLHRRYQYFVQSLFPVLWFYCYINLHYYWELNGLSGSPDYCLYRKSTMLFHYVCFYLLSFWYNVIFCRPEKNMARNLPICI